MVQGLVDSGHRENLLLLGRKLTQRSLRRYMDQHAIETIHNVSMPTVCTTLKLLVRSYCIQVITRFFSLRFLKVVIYVALRTNHIHYIF